MLKWSDELKSDEGVISWYDHVYCETPLGRALIEWKSWKEYDRPCVTIDGEWIESFDTVEEAKEYVQEYLMKKAKEIITFLEDNELK